VPYKDSDEQKAYLRDWSRRQIQERKDYVNRHKAERGCKNCDERDPIVLDLHHTDDNKEATVSKLVNRRKPWKLIFDELDKCEVLCANCHRRHHHLEREITQAVL
jgi:hypothetical protein